jgi:hypothetical protein
MPKGKFWAKAAMLAMIAKVKRRIVFFIDFFVENC